MSAWRNKRQHHYSILLNRKKRECLWAPGKERVGYKCIMSRGEKNCFVSLCECVCAEDGSEDKISEDRISTSNSLLGSCRFLKRYRIDQTHALYF